MDFTAIDFETATRHSDSACQLAAVRVRGGEIVEKASWLICPRPLRFSPQNIHIHGITPAMVRDEPEFGDLWPEIRKQLGEDCLIAHNASFDIGVLLSCLQTHGHPAPEMQYSCTRAIARRSWPDQPRFGLKPLSDWLGIRFRHHDALEDSIACAKIALAAATDLQADSLEDLEQKLKISRGAAGEWGKQGPSVQKRKKTRRGVDFPHRHGGHSLATSQVSSTNQSTSNEVLMTAAGTDLQRLLIRAEFIQPLAGRRVVFSGTFRRLARDEAELLTARCGGTYQSSVSGKTDLLVLGEPDPRTHQVGRSISVKEEAARKLIAAGAAMQIVTEDDFLQLICQLD